MQTVAMKTQKFKEQNKMYADQYKHMYSMTPETHHDYMDYMNFYFDLETDLVKITSDAHDAYGAPLLSFTINPDGTYKVEVKENSGSQLFSSS